MTEQPDQKERDLQKCRDMVAYAAKARQFLGNLSLDELRANEMVQAAVARCVEIIGEAARAVSEETRKRAPEIPWPLIVGMRHILAHDYAFVNLVRVHEVVTRHLEPLIAELAPLIEALESETG
jgi:uncharacterized protein with HEPN domain